MAADQPSGRYVEVTTTWRVPMEATDNAWIPEAVEASKALTVAGARSINFRLHEEATDGR